MVAPISSLANMEMALYGGFGTNAAAPSYINGYMGGANNYSSYMNPAFYGYGYGNGYNNDYGNTVFGQTIPQGYASQTQTADAATPFQGLSKEDAKAFADYYANNLDPSESLMGAAAGGAAFGVLMHPRLIAHPWNSGKTIGKVEKMFAEAKKAGTSLNKLWVNPESNGVMREAYFQMHKAASRCESKLGLFRKSYKSDPAKLKEVQAAMKEMETLLKNPSATKEQIAEVTAKLKNHYTSDGIISRGFKKIKEGLGFKSTAPTLAETTQKILKENGKLSYKAALKKGGKFGFLMFAGIELLMGISKIKTAFSKDSETGWKQVGQTTVKALGNAGGWALGEAAGIWASAAVGAKIGTLFGPGVGTAIGGLLGIVGGTVGMWLTGKATKAIVGDDVANKVEAEKLAQSSDGQVQLIQFALEKAQAGEKLDPKTQKAVQSAINLYA